MEEYKSKRILIGLDKDSFAPVAALLAAALGSVLSLLFAILNVTAMDGREGIFAAGDDVIFVYAGAVNIAACVFAAVAVILSRRDPRFKIMLTLIGAPFAVSFLLGMIGGIMRRGQYTNVVEILYFIFLLIAALALAAVFTRFISRKKSLLALGGLSVIAVLCAFIPVFTGNVDIVAALQHYIPSCVIIASFAVLAAGADHEEVADEKI